jgi:hypothetical protein
LLAVRSFGEKRTLLTPPIEQVVEKLETDLAAKMPISRSKKLAVKATQLSVPLSFTP